MKQKISQALAYPVILMITLLIVIFFLFQNVLPTFVDLFRDTGSSLPTSTRILLGASSFFSRYGVFILLMLFFLGSTFGCANEKERIQEETSPFAFFIFLFCIKIHYPNSDRTYG